MNINEWVKTIISVVGLVVALLAFTMIATDAQGNLENLKSIGIFYVVFVIVLGAVGIASSVVKRWYREYQWRQIGKRINDGK